MGSSEIIKSVMNLNQKFLRFVFISVVIYTSCLPSQICDGAGASAIPEYCGFSELSAIPQVSHKSSAEIEELNVTLKNYLMKSDLVNAKNIAQKILQKTEVNNYGDNDLTESYYIVGVYFLMERNFKEAIHYLNLCTAIKEKNKEFDALYLKAFYNLGLVYNKSGDFIKYEKYGLKSLELYKKLYGENKPELLSPYLATINVMLNLKNYDKAISFVDTALAIAVKNPELTPPLILADLYDELGFSYDQMGDKTKSKIYYDKTKSIYDRFDLPKNDDYINLLNSLAIVYSALGRSSESEAFYEQGIKLAVSLNSVYSFNFIRSYCTFLAHENQTARGEKLFKETIERARAIYNNNPRDYFELLSYFAGYLREYNIDTKKSLQLYQQCFDYLKNNQQDLSLKFYVYFGYSQTLQKNRDTKRALEIIDALLFPGENKPGGFSDNSLANTLKPDLFTVRSLRIRYSILCDIYKKKHDLKTLEEASGTSELIIALLDKVRINISEEESRLILGDNFRNSYLNAINDFNQLYTQTGQTHYLEKAFEYSEKSKVAGLLTSTRELKAIQFHIPANIAGFERELQR